MISRVLTRAAIEAHGFRAARKAGLIGGDPPAKTLAVLKALRAYGALGALAPSAAIRHGERTGLIDEIGALTFSQLDRRSNALANAWRARGLSAGDGVAILCRNHRYFADALFAATKVGCRAIFLNTDFAGPQIRDVSKREGTDILVHDAEYAEMLEGVEARLGTFIGWTDDYGAENTLETLIRASDPSPPPAPDEHGRVVLLTSGTTGTPKGAPRPDPRSLAPLGALLSKVPFRSAEATYNAAPFFHALGSAHLILATSLGSTTVCRRRFDPLVVLDGIAEHRCSALIVVPVMLNRILALDEEVRRERDLSSLRIVFCAGAQLEADLAVRAQEALGDVLYNLYGSTEVAYATIGTPSELRIAPGSAGTPPYGTIVRLYDDTGKLVEGPGEVGRIFVGNPFQFEGYTGGGNKEVIDGLMSSGDVGHFDEHGHLFVDGRDDEMIVSGGENVFPREIEELLVTHDAIDEAALIGVDDADFGKRLRAFVVRVPGREELGEDDVKELVKSNLARFKVPRDVVFVDELPRNPSGKVLKRELAEVDLPAAS